MPLCRLRLTACSTVLSRPICSSRTAHPTSCRHLLPTISAIRSRRPTDELKSSVIRASAIARLADVLESRLRGDDSLAVLRDIEMPLVPVLTRMERVGVGIDCEVLAALSADATKRAIEELRREIHALAGLRVHDRLAKAALRGPVSRSSVCLLRNAPRPDSPPTPRCSPRSPQRTRSPPGIVAYRELTKLKSTYLDAAAAPPWRGQTAAHVVQSDGRRHWQALEFEPQPARTSQCAPNTAARSAPRSFLPSRATGSSRRTTARSSCGSWRIFPATPDSSRRSTSGMDFHMATAARVFGVEPEASEPGMRARAKAVQLRDWSTGSPRMVSPIR